jgi:hypothetical protein
VALMAVLLLGAAFRLESVNHGARRDNSDTPPQRAIQSALQR